MITIFIKSYHKDFKLLYYALWSIKKNVKGNYDVVLVLDKGHDLPAHFNEILPNNTRIIYERLSGNGYLFQQYCKMTAHRYTNAPYILFSDSDCIFDREINVDEYISDGKPEILYTDYEKTPDARIWRKATEDFIKEPVQYEMMRRNCLIYHRSTLEAIEAYAPNLRSIVLTAEKFSEFNAMSVYAWKYERDKYNFINTDDWDYVDPKGVQLWSWAEKDNPDPTHQYEYRRSLEILNRVFELNLTEI